MNPHSSGNKLILGIIIGAIIIVVLAIAGYFGYKSLVNKPSKQTVPAPTQTDPLAKFDGIYTGTSDANQGITNATANIVSGKITGSANYSGAFSTQITLSITGTVDANGDITGNLFGTGSSEGEGATVTGLYSGKITGDKINVNWSGSGGGENASGSIVLTKN